MALLMGICDVNIAGIIHSHSFRKIKGSHYEAYIHDHLCSDIYVAPACVIVSICPAMDIVPVCVVSGIYLHQN